MFRIAKICQTHTTQQPLKHNNVLLQSFTLQQCVCNVKSSIGTQTHTYTHTHFSDPADDEDNTTLIHIHLSIFMYVCLYILVYSYKYCKSDYREYKASIIYNLPNCI